MDKSLKSPLYTFFITVLTFVAAYYACILLHEWLGHGFAAWVIGDKNTPFDIYYGGWALLHVDENVDYANGLNISPYSIIFHTLCYFFNDLHTWL